MIAVGVVRVTSKKAKLEDPPPGAGFTTVTTPVPACARLDAGTAACKVSPLTKVVARACPFHCASEPETNPTPLMVIVRPPEPGVALAGASGWPMNGTGFEAAGRDCELSSTGWSVTAMPSSRQITLAYFIV